MNNFSISSAEQVRHFWPLDQSTIIKKKKRQALLSGLLLFIKESQNLLTDTHKGLPLNFSESLKGAGSLLLIAHQQQTG